jgi:hypothetical protein
MSTLAQILEAALELPWQQQEALMQAMQKNQSEIRQPELMEYVQQMKLEVRSGKLRPQSISEIMRKLDEPLADFPQSENSFLLLDSSGHCGNIPSAI